MNPGFIAATLTAALVALRLTGVIGWSWWLVFLPEILFVAVNLAAYALARVIVSRLMKCNAADIIGVHRADD